jgi:hypothetical protein
MNWLDMLAYTPYRDMHPSGITSLGLHGGKMNTEGCENTQLELKTFSMKAEIARKKETENR